MRGRRVGPDWKGGSAALDLGATKVKGEMRWVNGLET